MEIAMDDIMNIDNVAAHSISPGCRRLDEYSNSIEHEFWVDCRN